MQGRRVVPGFYDSHVHLLGAGLGLARVQLKDAKDEAEFGRRLREFDAKLPKDRWLLGGEWDHDRAFNGELPTAAMVDKYVPDRPVFLRRYDRPGPSRFRPIPRRPLARRPPRLQGQRHAAAGGYLLEVMPEEEKGLPSLPLG